MKAMTCPSTRRRLQAFHDHELPVDDQIAVAAHLEWCTDCANQYAGLRFVRAALREGAPGRALLAREEAVDLGPGVVSRLNVEHDQAFFMRVREKFEDIRLVYAGVGAAAATAVCLVIMLGMMRFATTDRPDSLAAIVNLLASPGSNAYPVFVDARTNMPHALDGAISADATHGDAVFALAAVVTREGRVEHMKMLDADDGGMSDVDAERVVKDLMHAMSRTRFEPAQREGLPVAVNIVWLVAQTTVRGTPPVTLDAPQPSVKKRSAATLTLAPQVV